MPNIDRNDENATRYEPGLDLDKQIDIMFRRADRAHPDYYDKAILASLTRLRAIEQAEGMPEEPDYKEAQDFMRSAFVVDRVVYDDLRRHAQHLQDRLNRMEVLMREPTPEMIDVGFDAAGKQYSPDPTDDGLELTFAVWKAMSAALLAKLEKEKE